MDPLSVTASCVSLLGAIIKTSAAVNGFIRGCREARADLSAVVRELSDLKLIVELLKDDTNSEDEGLIPANIRTQIASITSECQRLLGEIDGTLANITGKLAAIKWAAGEKTKVSNLRQSLEAHRRALSLAVDIANLTVSKAIKQDTGQIPEVKENTEHILSEIRDVREFLAGRSLILGRYIDDLTSYAESVGYQDDMSDPDEEIHELEATPHSSPRLEPAGTGAEDNVPIQGDVVDDIHEGTPPSTPALEPTGLVAAGTMIIESRTESARHQLNASDPEGIYEATPRSSPRLEPRSLGVRDNVAKESSRDGTTNSAQGPKTGHESRSSPVQPSKPTRPPPTLPVSGHYRMMTDHSNYDAYRSLNLPHPPPRPSLAELYKAALESQAQEFDSRMSPPSAPSNSHARSASESRSSGLERPQASTPLRTTTPSGGSVVEVPHSQPAQLPRAPSAPSGPVTFSIGSSASTMSLGFEEPQTSIPLRAITPNGGSMYRLPRPTSVSGQSSRAGVPDETVSCGPIEASPDYILPELELMSGQPAQSQMLVSRLRKLSTSGQIDPTRPPKFSISYSKKTLAAVYRMPLQDPGSPFVSRIFIWSTLDGELEATIDIEWKHVAIVSVGILSEELGLVAVAMRHDKDKGVTVEFWNWHTHELLQSTFLKGDIRELHFQPERSTAYHLEGMQASRDYYFVCFVFSSFWGYRWYPCRYISSSNQVRKSDPKKLHDMPWISEPYIWSTAFSSTTDKMAMALTVDYKPKDYKPKAHIINIYDLRAPASDPRWYQLDADPVDGRIGGRMQLAFSRDDEQILALWNGKQSGGLIIWTLSTADIQHRPIARRSCLDSAGVYLWQKQQDSYEISEIGNDGKVTRYGGVTPWKKAFTCIKTWGMFEHDKTTGGAWLVCENFMRDPGVSIVGVVRRQLPDEAVDG